MMNRDKIIRYVLVVFLVMMLCISSFGTSVSDPFWNKSYIDNSFIEKYAHYYLDIDKMYSDIIGSEDKSSGVPILDILKNTPVIEENTSGDVSGTTYDGKMFGDYLPEFKEMSGIYRFGTALYVQYKTKSDETVALRYSEDGRLTYKMVADYKRDRVVEITDRQAVVSEKFWTRGIIKRNWLGFYPG